MKRWRTGPKRPRKICGLAERLSPHIARRFTPAGFTEVGSQTVYPTAPTRHQRGWGGRKHGRPFFDKQLPCHQHHGGEDYSLTLP
jgi:hypothetical protein